MLNDLVLNKTNQYNNGNESVSRLYEQAKRMLLENDIVLIAHYYTDEIIQKLAEETGGFVSDSLEMARFGSKHNASNILVAGVYFMGETAKILSPEKKVFVLSSNATCSLDLSCPSDEFANFCKHHPDHEIVVYANTSAAVKAQADWVVTSSIAVDLVKYLHSQGKKIIWAPDRYLGDYIKRLSGAEMIIWKGSCIVHEEFKARGIESLKLVYPNAAVLAHPESPKAVLDLSDVIGSTTKLIKAVQELDAPQFIVATDRGIFYKMRSLAPSKQLILAPTSGEGATCISCGHCPWMAMNTLENLVKSLLDKDNEILIPEEIIAKASVPLQRMLDFKN